MKDILLSIIVPVYNVESYLRECLDSFYDQILSENEYEIICVNDGSTDGSAGILDEYALRHGNMHVYHQKNAGVSAARNVGLDHAVGKYVWFVDADDFIAMDCLSRLSSALKTKQPDLLFVLPIAFEDGTDTSGFHMPNVPRDESSATYEKWLWTRLYRRQIIIGSGVRFETGLGFAEDNLFCAMLKPFTENETKTDSVAYFYRRRNGSVSGTPTKNKMDLLIHACTVFMCSAKTGKITREDAAFIICPTMIAVMSNIAVMPHREARRWLRIVRDEDLFPLKREYRNRQSCCTKGLSTRECIQKKLKYRSYSIPGYSMLKVFRLIMKITRRIKSKVKKDI